MDSPAVALTSGRSALAESDPPPSPDLTAVGANLLRLVSTWPRWVKRRVETIDFLDEATIQRTVRVDIDLSAYLADDARISWKGLLLVPVAALRRQPHSTFVVDEHGAMLPRINKFEEREMCFAAMFGWAEQLTAQHGLTLGADFSVRLRTVISQEHQRQAANDLLAGEDEVSQVLKEDGAFRTALQDLTENFYLLAPLSGDSEALRVLRYCYVETLQTAKDSVSIEAAATEGLRTRLDRFADLILLTDTRYVIDVPAAGDCQSYHFEVNAPWDLTFTRADIVVLRGGRDQSEETYRDDDWHPAKAHLFLSIGEVISKGKATIEMRPMPTGLLRSSFLGAAGIAGMLTVATTLLVLDRLGWASTDLHTNAGALTLLLMMPSVAAGYLSRPVEHRLTAKFLFSVRVSVLTVALMSFFVASTIALRWTTSSMLWVWLPATALAIAFAARLMAQFLRARRGMARLRRAVRTAQVEREEVRGVNTAGAR